MWEFVVLLLNVLPLLKTLAAKFPIGAILPSAGDSSNQIHFDGYQVSNQCMALVRDNCLVPTKDAPELGYVKESCNEQYVPDVFYKVLIDMRFQSWIELYNSSGLLTTDRHPKNVFQSLCQIEM